MGQQREAHELRILGMFSMILTLLWFSLFAYAIHSLLPFNPVSLPLEKWVHARYWTPEGWAFFTRDPREEAMLLFARKSDGTWSSASLGPNSRPSNFFGLNRISRAQGVETGLLLSKIPQSAFQPCSLEPTQCLDEVPVALSLKNVSPHPTLCGQIGLALQKPIPWAWSRSDAKIIMPSRVVRIESGCGA